MRDWLFLLTPDCLDSVERRCRSSGLSCRQGPSDYRRQRRDTALPFGLFPTPESLAFHILDADGQVVGIVKAVVTGHRAQIGYVIHKPFWGRGLATAAVRHVVSIVETNPAIACVWATCAIDNSASARVLEKCGFQREGILRNWVTYPAQGGRAFDNYSYVRIPT